MQDNNRRRKPERAARERRELPSNVVVGRNAVMELVKSGAPVDKILVAGREGSITAIVAEAKKA
ncbi:MAG: 23S rRNA (guanosine(2251)-2'-O)-methyltransferase RlmB, partial [Clostridia bacterium]|nr:23S rRNA (guanosine(2251)-2'-O)-methyltransferase RlmB [Clostridia bacterium]